MPRRGENGRGASSRRVFAGWSALIFLLLFVAQTAAAGAQTTGGLRLSDHAARALEEFGLTDMARPAEPPAVLRDAATSLAVRAHTICLRAHFLVLSKRYAMARELLEEAARLCPDSYGVQLSLAELDARTFKEQAALERCDQLIQSQPDRIEAYELKGRILEGLGRVEDAMAVYSEALKRWPNSDFLVEHQLRLAFGRGDLDLTIEICKRRLERQPKHFNTLWLLGYIYALKAQEAPEKTELYRKSAECYEAALENRPRAIKLYPRLSEIYLTLGEKEKALATLRRGLVADPSDGDIRRAFEQLISPEGDDEKILAAYGDLADEYPDSPDIQHLYATQLLARRKYDAARRRFERLLELQPNDVETLVALGSVELQLREFARARERFERAVELAGDAETYQAIGSAYLRVGNFGEAADFFEKALERNPKNAAVYHALAEAYRHQGRLDEAIGILRRGLEHVIRRAQRKLLLLRLAEIHEQRGEPARALDAVREAYELDRTDMYLFLQQARLLLTVERDEAFQKLVEQGRKIFRGSQAEFRKTLVALLMEFHRYEQAIPEIRALIDSEPQRWQYYVYLATAYQRLRQSANGKRLYEEARERLGDSPDFYRFAARYHAMRYEHQQAYEALLQLLDRLPVPKSKELARERFDIYSSAIFDLGRLKRYEDIAHLVERAERELGSLDPHQMKMLRARALAEMKQYDEAIALYRELLKEKPDDASLRYEIGSVLNEAKRIDEAEKALRQCLKLLPESPQDRDDRELRATVLNHLGYMFAEEGIKLEEAARLLSEALRLEPRAGFIVDSMGWVQFKLGHIDEAIRLLKRALRYSSEDPVLYDHLGEAYARSGDQQKAIEYWREALRLDPGLDEIRAKIEKLTNSSP